MGFTFGSNAPTPGPSPSPGAGGVGFGVNVGPAPDPTAPPTAGPANVSFGSTVAATTDSATPAPTTDFSTGTSSSSNAAPSSGTTAPTAAGFSFSSSSATPVPASGPSTGSTSSTTMAAPSANTPAQSFSFGSNTPAPSIGAPAPSFPFGSGSAAPAASAPAQSFSFGPGTPAPSSGGALGGTNQIPSAPAQSQSPVLKLSRYGSVFGASDVWRKIRKLVIDSSQDDVDRASLAGQELIHVLQCQPGESDTFGTKLSRPKLPEWTQPNQQIRQQLASNPVVLLAETKREATLTRSMFEDVLLIANDLRISEEHALLLYARVNDPSNRAELADSIVSPYIDVPGASIDASVGWAARELYFYEYDLSLRTLLYLVQVRLNQDAGNAVLVATDELLDNGLISNLIEMVRECDSRLNQLLQQLRGTGESEHVIKAAQAHWRFIANQRESVAVCLFFLSYQTQWTVQEIAALIELTHSLSNNLKILDPFHDVPSPFESFEASQTQTSGWMALPPLREKNRLAWQKELVKQVFASGQPQLLRCVSILIMTALCTLDTQAELIDRTTHRGNSFGVGNAILPPGSTSVDSILPIHKLLAKEFLPNWQRGDVFGLLMAGYAMLLRTVPTALSSPRSVPPTHGNIDVRKTWRECLETPTELKSFTFARLALLPALQKPIDHTFNDMKCDVSEFLLAALSSFSAHYADVLCTSGDRPISRAKWEQDAEEDLALRRYHRDEQRNFQAWSGTNAGDEDEVPEAVDLLDRPDCMDDVMAFTIAVCSLGSEYALRFWNEEENHQENGSFSFRLAPSPALLELERQQESDDSLRALYYSFLAALALAKSPDVGENCAEIVHRILSADGQSTSWVGLMEVLRWYVKELNPDSDALMSKSSSISGSRELSKSKGSTAYYYLSDLRKGTVDSTAPERRSSTMSSTVGTKSRELGEDNAFLLLSILTLVGNVAQNSMSACLDVLNITLPVKSSNGSEIIGQDAPLSLLFSLAVMPVSPEIRGTVFRTIAALLGDGLKASTDEILKLREKALNAWELLESFQILPIYIFDQYPVFQDPLSQSIPRLLFPQSSNTLVGKVANTSWIPVDSRYGIVYEMEYIESTLGVYKSTEGFLVLLRSLLRSGGVPNNLGHSWRFRTGTTPYVEYVMNLVLPRATGNFRDIPPLPFRCTEDKNRLCSLALEVILCVASSYVIVESGSKLDFHQYFKNTRLEAMRQLCHNDVVDHITVVPHESDIKAWICDFQQKPNSQDQEQESQVRLGSQFIQGPFGLNDAQEALRPAVPNTTSPGFAALSQILNLDKNESLRSLLAVLVADRDDVEGADRVSLVSSLFLNTPPTFQVAIAGFRKQTDTLSWGSFLKALRPVADHPSEAEAMRWRERGYRAALYLLCAAGAREAELHRMLSLHGRTTLVPCLRFQAVSSATIHIQHIQVSSVGEVLRSHEPRNGVLSQIVRLVAYTSPNDDIASEISRVAAVLSLFVDKSLQSSGGIEKLLRSSERSSTNLARSFGYWLGVSARVQDIADIDLMRLILDRILLEMRRGAMQHDSLSLVLLGLPDNGGVSDKPRDCFDALWTLINDQSLVNGKYSEIVSYCHEAIYRLCCLCWDSTASHIVLASVERLRSVDYWKRSLLKTINLAGQEEVDMYAVHSIAWILKGICYKLHILAGSTPLSPPQPARFREVISMLWSSQWDALIRVIDLVPLERLQFSEVVSDPDSKWVVAAKRNLHGAPEVVNAYELVDTDAIVAIVKSSTPSCNESLLRTWAEHWNASVQRDCASAHLGKAISFLIECVSLNCKMMKLENATAAEENLRVISCILMRMIGIGSQLSQVYSMDTVYYTTATRNLAFASVSAAELVVSSVSLEARRLCLPTICLLVGRAIQTSETGHYSGPDGVRKLQRTSALAETLAFLLKFKPRMDTSEDGIRHMFRASQALARMAVITMGHLPVTEVLTARIGLSGMIDTFQNVENGFTDSSFCRDLLTGPAHMNSNKSCIEVMVDQLVSFDNSMANLLTKIACTMEGTNVLLEAGIMKRLIDAAVKYQSHEVDYIVQEQDSQRRVGIPHFFQGYVDLMSALLASQDPSHNIASQIASDIFLILRHYESVVVRVLRQFPFEGDTTRSLISCASRAKCILSHGEKTKHGMTHLAVLNKTKNMGTVIERELAVFLFQLAEHPLPRSMLPSAPKFLEDCRTTDVGITLLADRDDESWWNHVDLPLERIKHGWMAGFRITEDLCHFGAMAAEVAKISLWYSQQSGAVNVVTIRRMCRALFYSVAAINTVVAGTSDWNQSIAIHATNEYCSKFVGTVCQIIEELLVILLRKVQKEKLAPESFNQKANNEWERIVQNLLDCTKLDSNGLLAARLGDENTLSNIVLLAQALRKESDDLKH